MVSPVQCSPPQNSNLLKLFTKIKSVEKPPPITLLLQLGPGGRVTDTRLPPILSSSLSGVRTSNIYRLNRNTGPRRNGGSEQGRDGESV